MVDSSRKFVIRLVLVNGASILIIAGLIVGFLMIAGCDDSSQPLSGDAAGIVAAQSPHDAGADR